MVRSTISTLAGSVMFASFVALASGAPAQAATADECHAKFMAADTNHDGMLSDAELNAYLAFYQKANKKIPDTGLARDAFLADCQADMFVDANTGTTGTAVAATMSQADCEAKFTSLDVNKDGILDENEAPSYFATYRLATRPVADGKLTKSVFLTDCQAGVYVMPAATEGAPLEGANSFTKGQAKDRIMAFGGSGVSDLVKDEKGIWRGKAMFNGATQNVAVDYKGNVVFSK